MPPAIVRAGIIVAACTLTNVQDLAGAAPADGELRTFTLSKPAASRASTAAPPALLPPDRPPETERLTISAGVGYVQGADWGTELRAGGSIAGFLIDLDSLTTKGARGVLFDHGAATVTAPSRRWNATAGDVFSPLAGPGRGARLGWLTTPNHRMSVTYFTPWRGARQRFTRVLLRNELSIGGRSAMSAELSTDRSYRVEGRVRAGRFDFEVLERRQLSLPLPERSVAAQVDIGRGVRARIGGIQSVDGGQRSRMASAAIFSQVGPFDLTVEHGLNHASTMRSALSAAAVGYSSGSNRLFYRHQWGAFHHTLIDQNELDENLSQMQSVANFGLPNRVRLTLQQVGQWTDSGHHQSWQELASGWQPTRRTQIEAAAALPSLTDRNRLRLRAVQQITSRLAFSVDYGRVAPYQLTYESERPRLRVMVTRALSVTMPSAGGAVMTGTVRDQLDRPVAHVRVRVGSYAADTNERGEYRVAHLPAGSYTVGLDEQLLRTDYSWDGRAVTVSTKTGSRQVVDFRVAPLNTIGGQIVVDRRGDGQCRPCEPLAGVVLFLDNSRTTTTDQRGFYSFYNLPPGAHVIRADVSRLGALLAVDADTRSIVLDAQRAVTDANFVVRAVPKPIRWIAVAP